MTDLQTMPHVQRTDPAPEFEPITSQEEAQLEQTQQSWRAPTLLARAVGIAGAISLLIGAINLMGGHPSEFVQWTAIMIIAALVVFGLIASHGPQLLGRLLAVTCGSHVRNTTESEQLTSMCVRGRQLSYSGGVLAALAGLIHVMSFLDQPASIGPGVAVALIGPSIALVIAELGFGAAKHWVRAERS